MANYNDSVLLEARTKLMTDANRNFEQRRNLNQVIDLFLTSTNVAIPASELEKLKKSMTQAVKFTWRKKKAFYVSDAKTCDPSGETGDSGIITPTFVKRSFQILVSTKQMMGNDYNVVEKLADDIYDGAVSTLFDDASSVSQYLLDYLSTNRTQVNAASTRTQNTWKPAADYFMETAYADITRFYNYALSDMKINNYPSDILEIYSTEWELERAYQYSQGAGNSVNLAFQYPGFRNFASNALSPDSTYFSKHFLIPNGGVAMFNWTENDKMQSQYGGNPLLGGILDSGTQRWTTFPDIFFPNLVWDVFVKRDCGDSTAIGGGTQDPQIKLEFCLTFAADKMPLSTSGETPIFQYGVKAS